MANISPRGWAMGASPDLNAAGVKPRDETRRKPGSKGVTVAVVRMDRATFTVVGENRRKGKKNVLMSRVPPRSSLHGADMVTVLFSDSVFMIHPAILICCYD
jgi:hypothetical protein